jgi:hypothetical protein
MAGAWPFKGGDTKFSDSKSLGDREYLKCETGSVLNESAVFAINARKTLSLNCSETVMSMQLKFHLLVEFTAHILGISWYF